MISMYIPKTFVETDITVAHAIIQANPLATLIMSSSTGLLVNHVPMILVDSGKKLVAHVAKKNFIWKVAAESSHIMAVFQGEQFYVTPNWYETKKTNHKVVPTWNYEVVHVNGNVSVIHDKDWLMWQIELLTQQEENKVANSLKLIDDVASIQAWKVSDAPTDFIEKLTHAIVGLEFTIENVICQRKMSQNQPAANQLGVVKGRLTLI